MALKRWTGGAGDGNIGTAGNWEGGVGPVSGTDGVIFTGSSSVTAGHSALNASTWLGIETDETYTGSIGTVGLPLWVGASTNAVRHRGSGQFHLKAGNTYTPTGTFIDPKLASAICSVDATTSTIPLVVASRGVLTLTGTGTFTMVKIAPRFQSLNEITVTVAAGLTAMTALHIYGGTTTISQTCTDLSVFGGDVTLDSETTTLLNMNGGLVKLNYAPGTGSVAIATVHGYAGTLDLMQSTGGKKITTLLENQEMVGNAPKFDFRWLKDNNIHVVTTLIPFNMKSPGF